MLKPETGRARILLVFPPSFPPFSVEANGKVVIRQLPSDDADCSPGVSADAANDEDIPLESGGTLCPTLGPLYLASALLKGGLDVEIADFEAEPYSAQHIQQLLEGKDAVGFTVLTPSYAVKQMIRDIRRWNTDIPIVVGGPDITLSKVLLRGADVAVIGDAMGRVAEVFRRAIARKDLADIPGVIYRNSQGQAVHSQGEVPEEHINTLVHPARHLSKPRGYPVAVKSGGKYKMIGAYILTSRGCTARCRFCSIPDLFCRRYEERTVEDVVKEIVDLRANGCKLIWIADDTFTANKQRAHDIMDAIIARKLNVMLFAFSRVDAADEELFRKMRKAGVRMLLFGIESGNQDVLDFYGKDTTVEQNRRAVELANQCGLFALGFFILGAPCETKEHIQRSIQFALDLPLDVALFRPLFYVAGTPLWQEAVAKGLLDRKELVCIADRSRGLGHFSAEDYVSFCMEGTRRFFRRPRHILRVLWKVVRQGDWRFALHYFGIMYRGNMRHKLVFASKKKRSLHELLRWPHRQSRVPAVPPDSASSD